MDIINLVTGLFMIGVGFLVKSFPNLIAGYNTMPKDKKENVDIDGLSTYMRNVLIIIGLSIIIGYYLFNWIGFTMIANSMILIATIVGVTILVINAQRFDHNKNTKSKLTYFILGFVIVFIIGLITYGFIPSRTILNNNTIRFTGMYGFEMNISDIENIELAYKIPTINLRTNGFSFGTINKGTFNLDSFGSCRLLIYSDLPPFLIISNSNGQKVIINYKDKKEASQIYEKIKLLIKK